MQNQVNRAISTGAAPLKQLDIKAQRCRLKRQTQGSHTVLHGNSRRPHAE